MKVRFEGFKWYDFWVGVYYDRATRVLYICPLPCTLFTIQKSAYRRITNDERRTFVVINPEHEREDLPKCLVCSTSGVDTIATIAGCHKVNGVNIWCWMCLEHSIEAGMCDEESE